MNEIISKDDVDQLKFILNYHAGQQYIDCVQDVQDFMSNELTQVELPIFHHFAPDVYARQMDAEGGHMVVSKMHRTEHLNVLLKGSITVLTEDGIRYFEAPTIITSKAGTKRIGYFHEKSSWLTIHPTNETDLDKIEKLVIVPREQEKEFLQLQGEVKCLG